VKEHYSDVPIYVMANGVQEDPARFKDSLRVYYLYNYINEALKGEAPPTRRRGNPPAQPRRHCST
jgi:beta-glucosidase/6-phospho-beta-glucosidase/beta-galactosidase